MIFSGFLWISIIHLSGATTNPSNSVEEIFYWKQVNYEDLPYEEDSYIGNYPYYIPSNNDLLGLGYHAQSGLMLATVGRLRPGIPSVLNAFCFADYEKGTSPHLWGFPDYEKNTLKASFYDENQARKLLKNQNIYSARYFNVSYAGYHNLKGLNRYPSQNNYNFQEDYTIISVYHPIVDNQCNRLFILDTGTLYYGYTSVFNVQNPAILVFDLPLVACKKNSQFPLIRRVQIPNYLWKDPVGFSWISVDHQKKGTCDDVFLYISNVYDNKLVVYDYKQSKFWYVEDRSMQPIIAEASFVFNKNFHYDFPLGIMNLALGPIDKYGNRNAYFSPAASTGEYLVSTGNLKNSRKLSYKYNSEAFSLIGYRGCGSQTFSQALDLSTGVMFFGEMESNRIRCWNTQLPLNPDTIGVVFESDDLKFVSEIFIDSDGYLWFLTTHVPVTFLSSFPLDTTEINSRAFRVKVSEAIKGTTCDLFYSYT